MNPQPKDSQGEMSAPGALKSFHVFIVMVLILGACGTGGYFVTEDQMAQIKIGRSTKPGEGAIVAHHFAKLTIKGLTPSCFLGHQNCQA